MTKMINPYLLYNLLGLNYKYNKYNTEYIYKKRILYPEDIIIYILDLYKGFLSSVFVEIGYYGYYGI